MSADLYVNCERTYPNAPDGFQVVSSRGADGQMHIKSRPDEWWISKDKNKADAKAAKINAKASHLLITAAQDNSTARLTAIADNEKYIGNSWFPATGLSTNEAKALAVFINSTAGRLQLMRNLGKKLTYPTYRPAGVGNIRVPDIENTRIRQTLADCWERTRDMRVPQFRDGECEVRRLWDEAVAEAMGWDAEELTELRLMLHREPHVRGLGYNQYADRD